MRNIVSEQLQACAKAAKRLMHNGVYGPRADEISREAHGDLWPVGKEDIEWVSRHLPNIKVILEAEDDLSVCLVNKEYYSRFHRRVPATPEAAKLVLPKRGDFRAAGLHFVTSEGDTIWQASQEKIGTVGHGAYSKIKRNVSREVKNNRLSLSNGENFFKAIKDKAPS